MYQDAANDGFWYGYDDGAKLAHESDQEDHETARLDHSQGTNLSKTQILSTAPTKRGIVVMHSTADLQCIQCHVNPVASHAQNQNNHLEHLFVGRVKALEKESIPPAPSYPGHGDDPNVFREAGGAAARPPQRCQHAPEPLRPDAPVDGVARGLRRPGHSRAGVVVPDGLHGRGHHAGNQSQDSGQSDDGSSPLNWN